MKGIVLAYIGVHQIYQLALAAQEQGCLQHLFCSFHDAPGTWGRLFARGASAAALHPLGASQIDADRVTELPAALLLRRARQMLTRAPTDYRGSNAWFDRASARRLARLKPDLFVGVETCALECLRRAKRQGIPTVLDCPGIPDGLLAEELGRATDQLGMLCTTMSSSPRTVELKAEERELADHLFLCSELQRDWYLRQGIPRGKMSVNALWVDPAFAGADHPVACPKGAPLRVLFVGHASTAKGAPYAIEAMERVGSQATLTICGGVAADVRQWAGSRIERHRVIEWLPRAELVRVYREHDVLVFPSLGDSFGFVALEAMACGLPVITTTHVGAPVPDESWRVPVRDASALAARIEHYAGDRDRLAADSAVARDFAAAFTPAEFRRRAGMIFQQLLA